MLQALISVIIPVYNVEKYLERCVDSVRRQTLSNLEILLVDDGSPDNSPAMCDRFAQEDERIRVIHKRNGGLASARNAGLRAATGEYVFFLDSDDWLEMDGMELLYRKAQECDVDFVRYRAIRSGWPGMEPHAPCMVEPIRELHEGMYDRNAIIGEVYPRLMATAQLTMGAVVGACGSLYRLDFLRENDLLFYEEVKFSEDLIFSARVVRAARRFYFIDTPCVYHYFYNPNSISKSFREGRWASCKGLIHACERDFAADAEYNFADQLHCLRWFCIMLALNERRHLKTYGERQRYCSSLLKDPVIRSTKLGLNKLDVSWKQKLLMVFIRLRMSWIVAAI